MKQLLPITFFMTILLVVSCDLSEERISSSGNIKLKFSTDTVLFDTLLTERLSITKRFRIYNPSKNAVSISSIRLGKGLQSEYSIVVNGKSQREVADQVLFGGDSLLVLVDVNIDYQDADLPYLVKDSVVVEWNNNRAHVKLVAWGQDANFINGATICDETWTAERPYVIYNYAWVDSLCTLTMQPGTKVYLDNGAGFFVQGSLKVMGDSGNHVVFRNTRFDERYRTKAPGQWFGVLFIEGSQENEIHFADIENGDIGLGLGFILASVGGNTVITLGSGELTTQLDVYNTSVRYMSSYGIQAFASELKMVNSEVFFAGAALVANGGGGTYQYDHCTFSNYPNDFQPEDPAFVFSDVAERFDGHILSGDLNMSIKNSIIWGSNDEEYAFGFSEENNVNVELDHNIVRTKQDLGPDNFTSVEDNFPGFINPIEFDYDLDSLAFARDKGLDLEYEFDIKGEARDDKPDIGAHERIDP